MPRSTWKVLAIVGVVALLIGVCVVALGALVLMGLDRATEETQSLLTVERVPSPAPTPSTALAQPTTPPPSPTPVVVFPTATPLPPAPTPIPASPTPSPTPSPMPTLPPDVTFLPPGGPRAATGLQATVECSVDDPSQGIARLSWSVAASPGSEQRVAVTLFKDGFETGQFEITGALPPDQSSFDWTGLHGQAIHLWRVLTLHPEGWVPSETASFEAPTCAVDFGPPAPSQ